MIKLSSEEKLFLLRVLAYEFPGAKESDDANWLVVEIEAADGSLSWCAKGAFLRTHELVALHKWLGTIASNKKVGSEVSFTEGELAFRFEPENELVVVLDFEFHPKGSNYDYANDLAFSMRFHMPDVKLSSLISDLEREIKKFPVR